MVGCIVLKLEDLLSSLSLLLVLVPSKHLSVLLEKALILHARVVFIRRCSHAVGLKTWLGADSLFVLFDRDLASHLFLVIVLRIGVVRLHIAVRNDRVRLLPIAIDVLHPHVLLVLVIEFKLFYHEVSLILLELLFIHPQKSIPFEHIVTPSGAAKPFQHHPLRKVLGV